MCLIMVCHIGVWLGTKVVKSALRMLALYMYFNGTGIPDVTSYILTSTVHCLFDSVKLPSNPCDVIVSLGTI